MAYTSFTPSTRVTESQDGKSFKIWDESTWNGESDNTISCYITLTFIDADGNSTIYQSYYLITGGDKTKFNEYLSTDGHQVNISDLTISGSDTPERFEDGYYIVKVTYSDGSYSSSTAPYYNNYQAFLAKNRCMKRKLATKVSFPLTDASRRTMYDIHLHALYLENAEDAVDLNKITQFRELMGFVKAIFDKYEIEECW